MTASICPPAPGAPPAPAASTAFAAWLIRVHPWLALALGSAAAVFLLSARRAPWYADWALLPRVGMVLAAFALCIAAVWWLTRGVLEFFPELQLRSPAPSETP